MVRTGKPTLRDVAARAGVSRTTASYILNDRSTEMRIAVETQRRVQQAVAELGYRPNRTALSLKTKKTRTIGLISDHVASGEFANQMLTGAITASREREHVLLIGETGGDRVLERELIDEMLDREVDGMVYATLITSRITVPSALRQVRTVLLNCFDAETTIPSVLPDEFEGGRSAARVIIDAGEQERVYAIGSSGDPVAIAGERRLAGVRHELSRSGQELAGLVLCDWRVDSAYEAVGAWLDDGAHPSALICLNDRIAMGAYQALAERNLAIPTDVSVASFDGSSLAQWLRPTLTSVALPFDELGATAVSLLMDAPATNDGVVEIAMPVRHGRSVRQS